MSGVLVYMHVLKRKSQWKTRIIPLYMIVVYIYITVTGVMFLNEVFFN